VFPAIVAITLAGCGRYSPGNLPQTTVVTQDAAWDGDMAVSPDGRTLAFVSDREDGRRGLFVRPIKGGAPRALVTGPGDVSRPSWSRDGRKILFTRLDPNSGTGRALVVDAAGGTPAALGLGGFDVRDAVYSPDGTRVAFVTRTDSSSTLAEAAVADLKPRSLYVVEGPGEAPTHPTWRKDGSGLVFAWKGDLWWASSASGPAVQLTTTPAREHAPSLSPNGNWLAFVSDSTGEDNAWLAQFDGKALGAWRPATASFQPVGHPAWDPKGRTLWFDRQDPWVVAARTVGADVADTLSSSLFDSREPAMSGDGSQVAFSSPRVGPWRLWVMKAEGEAASGPARQVTDDNGSDRSPDWGRSSAQIVFVHALQGAGDELELTDASGSRLGTLTQPAGMAPDRTPAWSPDARSVAFGSLRSGAPAVWVIEGVSRQLRAVAEPPGGATDPSWQNDGRSLIYAAPAGERVGLWLVPLAGGTPTLLTQDTIEGSADGRSRVSPDGTRLVFTRQRRGDRDLWLLDLATGEARALVINGRGQDDHADWSPDGRRLVYETGGAVNLYRADVRPLLLR